MILIASPEAERVAAWYQALEKTHQVYHGHIPDHKTLQICLKKNPCDVLILDLRVLSEEGVHEISTLKEQHPKVEIILMSPEPNSREEIAAIIFGARAYCSLNLDPNLLPEVIKTVLSDEVWVSEHFVPRLLEEIADITAQKHAQAQQMDKGLAHLTARELEVAHCVAQGASNQKIATTLNISERTVKAHLGAIFKKLQVTDRLQLALYMNRHEQISPVWHIKN